MSPARRRTPRSHAALAVVSLVGVFVGSYLSLRRDAWSRVVDGAALGAALAILLLILLVMARAIRNQVDLTRLRKRPALSDDAFIAPLPQHGKTSGEAARVALQAAQTLTSNALGHIDGDWLRPTERKLHVDADQVGRMLQARTIVTFGDLVLAIADLAQAGMKPHPLWNRDLDA